MRARLISVLSTLAITSLALAPDTVAHSVEGANLQLIAELTEDKLIYDVSAETSLVPPLDHVVHGAESFPAREDVAEALTAYFAEHCPVRIDGIEVRPVLEDVQFDALENQVNLGEVTNFVMAYFILHYPVKSKPQTVDMTWDIFLPEVVNELVPDTPDPTGHTPQTVDSIFYTFGELDLMTFTPEEPQYIWHTPDPILSVDARARLQRAAENAGTPGSSFSLAWPLAALLFLGALVTGVRQRLPLTAGLVATGLALAAAHRPLTVQLGSGREPLDTAAALQRFQDLHQNIYRAFDYDNDDAIYDTLAQSVAGDLLDEIYRDVYRSLVLKDEGGAVCRVKKLEYLECQPVDPGNGRRKGYAFEAHWRVHGLVQHWGHTHQRVNEYKARYHLSPLDGLWKIDYVEIAEERRLNPKTLDPIG